MTRLSKSFILSLLIHSVLAVLLFVSYKTIFSNSKEQHLCSCCSTTINLNTIQTVKTTVKETRKKEPENKPIIKEKKITTHKILSDTKVVEEKVEAEKNPLFEETVTVVQPDQNITHNTEQKEEIDTHCKTEVIATSVPQKADEYVQLHVAEIVALLKENLYYPRRARKQGIEGVVRVKFTLSKTAEISNIVVISSEDDILANAAVETISNLEGKLPKPKDELVLTIPINYDLK